MARKKALDETQLEPQELQAEQTEGMDAPSDDFTAPAAEMGQKPVLGTEPSADNPTECEPDADASPIEAGFPAEEIPDVVSVEFGTGGDGEAVPPEADIPYGEENGDGLPTDGGAKEHVAELAPEQEAADDMSGIAGAQEAQPEAALPEPEPESAAPTEQSEAPDAPANERRAFFGLDFRELDRSLTPEQRQEWNSIYASYRGRSVMSGQVVGVDRVRIRTRDKSTGEMIWRRMYCAIVIPFRVRILIPESEMWMDGDERPGFVLRNIAGANIDFAMKRIPARGHSKAPHRVEAR